MIFQIATRNEICGYIKAKNKDSAIHKAKKRGFVEAELYEVTEGNAFAEWQEINEQICSLTELSEELEQILDLKVR